MRQGQQSQNQKRGPDIVLSSVLCNDITYLQLCSTNIISRHTIFDVKLCVLFISGNDKLVIDITKLLWRVVNTVISKRILYKCVLFHLLLNLIFVSILAKSVAHYTTNMHQGIYESNLLTSHQNEIIPSADIKWNKISGLLHS